MKCLVCGEPTDKNILCRKHIGVDGCLESMTVHTCGSFRQKSDEIDGTCVNCLSCAPIKSALKHEIFVKHGLGHIICPYASINLAKIIYSDIKPEQFKENYSECLE
jgi:hypothetical protein